MGDHWKRRSKGFDDFDLKDLRNLRMGKPLKYGLMAVVGVTLAVCMCGLLITACLTYLFFSTDSPAPAEPAESVRERSISPDGRITALEVHEPGSTFSCTIRVDLETTDRTVRDVYRSTKVCDATLEWEGSNLLLITDETGTEKWVDMREQGLAP